MRTTQGTTNGEVRKLSKQKSKGMQWLYYATTLQNAAFALGVVAALKRTRLGWLSWTLAGLGFTMIPRFNRLSYQVLRWPVLFVTYAVIALELTLYLALRVFLRAMESAVATPKHRELRRKLHMAADYEHWLHSAHKLDASKGSALWQADLRSTRYNWPFVQDTIRRLREARAQEDWRAVVQALRLCSRPNVGGVMAPQLFSATYTGEPKTIVTDFVEEVAVSIAWLTHEAIHRYQSSERHEGEQQHYNRELLETKKTPNKKKNNSRQQQRSSTASSSSSASEDDHIISEETDEDDVLFADESSEQLHASDYNEFGCFESTCDLFRAGVASYGRTVLSLSGGGALGTYHFGVCRALLERGLMPKVVCGTSAGGIVAAFVCTRTDEELKRDLYDDDALHSHLTCFERTPLQCLKRLVTHGVAYDNYRWMEIASWFANEEGLKNMTFKEAYKRSRRKLAITVCAKGKRAPPVLLTHITSPNVVITSAIVATAGVPGLLLPTILLEKDPETGVVGPQPGGEAYIDGSIVHDIPNVGLREAFNAKFVIASQVNPHIAPFIFHTHGAPGEPSRWSSPRRSEDAWHGGFLLAAAELYLRSDMLNKLQWLQNVDVMPGWSGRLLTQNFEGTTTIMPALQFRDYFQVFQNPTKSTMARFLREGRVATYQKIVSFCTFFFLPEI